VGALLVRRGLAEEEVVDEADALSLIHGAAPWSAGLVRALLVKKPSAPRLFPARASPARPA
jgi:hypothetical protein